MAIEAEALRALSEKATQGEWHHRQAGLVGNGGPLDWIGDAPSGFRHSKIIVGKECLYGGTHDYAFIAALVSAYRDGSLIHRSALAEDTARAAEEIKNLRELTDAADWLISCHERIQSAVPCRDLPEAIAAYKGALTRVSFAALPLTKEAADANR